MRIGPALRPEFAAWRYGDQFGRRRRRAILYGVGGVTVLTTLVIGGLFAGAAYGAVLGQSGNIANLIVNARTVLKLRTEDGKVIKLRAWTSTTRCSCPDRMASRGAWRWAPTTGAGSSRDRKPSAWPGWSSRR